MKILLLLVLTLLSALLLSALVFSPTVAVAQAQVNTPEDISILRTTGFVGTPQFLEFEIFNSGIVTMTMSVGTGHTFPDEFGGGVMYYRKYDGSTGSVPGSSWKPIGEGVYRWVQYIPYEFEELWLETTAPVSVIGFGPWEVIPGGVGIQKSEPSTAVVPQMALLDQDLWVWDLNISPDWQYLPWVYTVTLQTNCRGDFEWQVEPLGDQVITATLTTGQIVADPRATLKFFVTNGPVYYQGTVFGPRCQDPSAVRLTKLVVANVGNDAAVRLLATLIIGAVVLGFLWGYRKHRSRRQR